MLPSDVSPCFPLLCAACSHCRSKPTLFLLIHFKVTTTTRLGLKNLWLPHAVPTISFSPAIKHLFLPLWPGLLRAFLPGVAVSRLSPRSEVANHPSLVLPHPHLLLASACARGTAFTHHAWAPGWFSSEQERQDEALAWIILLAVAILFLWGVGSPALWGSQHRLVYIQYNQT